MSRTRQLRLSRLGFGTAAIHHLRSTRDRHRLLEEAAAAGLTHFDTAPLYGFGLAERSLAPILAANAHLTVATKVGLYPPGGADQSNAGMVARKLLGKAIPSLSRFYTDWSVKRAEESLDASLRRLQRDSVDLLLLHEPDIEGINSDEWLAWLEREHERGRVKAYGLAGAMSNVGPFLEGGGPITSIVQSFDSLGGHEADSLLARTDIYPITYGYFAGLLPSTTAITAVDVLNSALRRNNSGTVLVSTRKRARIVEFARSLLAESITEIRTPS